MLPIHWSAQALDELDAIIGYIAQRSPSAAERMHALIEAAVLPLAEHPYLCRQGRVEGTRELLAHPNYWVIYRVLADQIEIAGVLHAARQFPPSA